MSWITIRVRRSIISNTTSSSATGTAKIRTIISIRLYMMITAASAASFSCN
tara:strand:+ start:528 stop:680 length:153 start_codon:yes stop_codon:yes gene_type:complete